MANDVSYEFMNACMNMLVKDKALKSMESMVRAIKARFYMKPIRAHNRG